MTPKSIFILCCIALGIAFAAGRYSASGSIIKTTEQTTTDTTKQVDRDTHKDTTTVVEEDGTGKKKTTTIVKEDTTTRSKTDEVTKDDKSSVTTPVKRNTLNVSALASVDIKNFVPVYGLSVTKEVLGPITVGAFGLTSGVVGVSVGLDF